MEIPEPIQPAKGVQICFCELGDKPYGEPDSHDTGCLMPGFLTAWKAAAERDRARTPLRTPLRDRMAGGAAP